MAYFLSPALVQLRSEVNALWPNRSKASDGWIGDTSHQARPSDHNPDYSDGGIVRAIDVTNAGIDVDRFVAVVIRDPRTRYVITRGRLWSRDNGWVRYTGPNPHNHHVHVSARSVGSYDRDGRSWGLASLVSNPIGGGGSIGIPNIPGAPAPINPEDDMFSDEDRATLQLIRRIATENQSRITNGVAISTENQKRISRAVDIVTENQKRIGGVASDVWRSPVRRNGEEVSALQELADAKTQALALSAALQALAGAQGKSGEDTIAAVRAEIRKALTEGTVRVEIGFPNDTKEDA